MVANLLTGLPDNLEQEVFECLVSADQVRIERIISQGHSSPAEGWYDQDEHEWVLVLQGAGELEFESGDRVRLTPGDSINIAAHCRHRVCWTDAGQPTIWLAVFYA